MQMPSTTGGNVANELNLQSSNKNRKTEYACDMEICSGTVDHPADEHDRDTRGDDDADMGHDGNNMDDNDVNKENRRLHGDEVVSTPDEFARNREDGANPLSKLALPDETVAV